MSRINKTEPDDSVANILLRIIMRVSDKGTKGIKTK
jgi:hypothetical protein